MLSGDFGAAIQISEVSSKTEVNNMPMTAAFIGANPCAAPVATLSIKDMRQRGSAYVRSHASKHGIPNASRKLMTEVLVKLRDHYAAVHGISMINDDSLEHASSSQNHGGGKVAKKRPARVPDSSGVGGSASMLPKMPLSHLQLTIKPDQIQPLLLAQLSPFSEMMNGGSMGETTTTEVAASHHHHHHKSTTAAIETHSKSNSNVCTSRVLAKSEHELHTFGTSLLRPEAAAHKVHNSSRKPKHLVIAELWKHYVQYHAKELQAQGSSLEEMGWVGTVEDDDEDK